MAFLDHIAACNAHDLAKFRPWLVDRRHVGWIRHDTAALLRAFPDVFRVEPDAVTLQPELAGPAERSAALERVSRALVADHRFPRMRGEKFAVVTRWGEEPLLGIDRGHASAFGIRAFGVHVNGFVRTPEGLELWIGKRAEDKPVAPGKLDNLVAGGQPMGLGLFDNVVKEAEEEAAIPAELARQARPVGAVSYCLEDERGLKPDTMFCYDLELPADFTPRPNDGEVVSFTLTPVDEVARRVRDGFDFKFNVNLVILDFLLRHGVLSPDTEPDYVAIANGLRKGW